VELKGRLCWARICKPSKGPRNRFLAWRVGMRRTYLTYQAARQATATVHRLAESIPGLLKHLQIRAQATLASGIGSLESIPPFHDMKNEDGDDFFGPKRRYSTLNYQKDEE